MGSPNNPVYAVVNLRNEATGLTVSKLLAGELFWLERAVRLRHNQLAKAEDKRALFNQ